MLILITGVPGSGKSLYAVDLITKYQQQNEQLIKEGKPPRAIYSDIDGLTIDGVLEAPDDWRECPDGSIVFYDECQQKFGPDGQGRSHREDIQEFETHRHRGFDIILITQHPKLLHSHIRRLVGRHHHIFRMYGTNNAKVFSRDGQIDVDKPSAINSCDDSLFTYPKHLFGQYKSATLHTHKPSMPKWMKRGFVAIFVILIILFFLFPYFWSFVSGDAVKDALGSDQPVKTVDQTTQLQASKPSVKPVACIASSDRCVCYEDTGYQIKTLDHYCRTYTEDMPLFIELRSSDT